MYIQSTLIPPYYIQIILQNYAKLILKACRPFDLATFTHHHHHSPAPMPSGPPRGLSPARCAKTSLSNLCLIAKHSLDGHLNCNILIWLVAEPYPSEKWWSSSMGRMTSHIWNGKINNCPNHQPVMVTVESCKPKKTSRETHTHTHTKNNDQLRNT